MLEAAVAAGVAAAGGEALLGGVLPTPGAPLLIGRYGLDLGVGHLRLAQPVPRQRHQVLRPATASSSTTTPRPRSRRRSTPPPPSAPASAPCGGYTARSRTTCAGCTSASPNSTCAAARSLLDCANGATYRAAPGDLPPPRRRGRRCSRPIPDGRNINDGCGSTHVEGLAETMREGRHDARLRLRRRRRPGARGRPQRRGRRRRRADRAGRAAPARRRPPARQRRRGDRDDQLRLPHGDARRRRRGRDDAGRRPLRARGAARARLGARRRAVGPHHRHGLRPLGRRHRRRAADARGARRRRPRRPPRRWRSCPSGSSTCGWPTAPPSPPRRPPPARRSSARRRRSRAAGACSCAQRHRAARARDGRGADRGRGRRGLRAPRRAVERTSTRRRRQGPPGRPL